MANDPKSEFGRSDPETRRRSEAMDEVLEGALARLEDTVDAISAKRNTPRNKDIRRTMKVLERVWLTFPQLRLCQLLSNAMGEELQRRDNDIFYIEDDEVVRFVNEYHNQHFRNPTRVRRR